MDAEFKRKFEEDQAVWAEWHANNYFGNEAFAEGLKLRRIEENKTHYLLKKMCLHKDCPEMFFDFLDTDTKNWNILEIGCGFGLLGTAFVDHVEKYLGVDIDQNLINRGNVATKEAGINNTQLFCVGQWGIHHLKDDHFDFIFNENAFIHIPRFLTRQYLEQTAKKLKSNGLYHFSFNTIHGVAEGIHRNTTESYTFDELHELFEDTGLFIHKIIENPEHFAENQFGIHVCGGRADNV
jgi:predicted TPR repeat methyltransferase